MRLGSVYWLFAVVYSFINYSFWVGVGNMFLPIAPLIDLVKMRKNKEDFISDVSTLTIKRRIKEE